VYALTYTGPLGSTGGTGTLKWSFDTGHTAFASPSVTPNGVVYIGGSDTFYALPDTGPVGSTGGTGTVLWQLPVPTVSAGDVGISYTPAIGQDGTIYIGSNLKVYSIITTPPPPSAICFLKGTQILTTHGEVLVENLTLQDEVITRGDIVDGKTYTDHSTSRVKNIIHFTEHNLGQYSRPICLQKDYASPNVPNRDLYISPLHCMLVGDEMVQVHNLVNGTTIAYDMTFSSAEYYHIVLEKHSVIYSNNLATESCSFVELAHEHYISNPLAFTKTIQCV